MSQPIFGYKNYELIEGTSLGERAVYYGLPSELRFLIAGDPCWYCNTLSLIPDSVLTKDERGHFLKQNISLCSHCGWWILISYEVEDIEYYEPKNTKSAFAKLCYFDVDDKSIDLDILSSAMARDWEKVRSIHPRKFEELSASILSSLYNCEVRLTGYSKDNGIDLYSVICDVPWAFQVKRRSKSVHEGIEEIKEFIGSMIQNNSPNGVFVTTSSCFTKGAKELVENDNLRKFGLRLKLINGNDFRDYFKLYYVKKEAVWHNLFLGNKQNLIDRISNSVY